MISPFFDAQKFFETVRGYDYDELLKLAEEECAEAEALSRSRPGGPKARAQGSVQYAALLKEFLYFLRHGKRPGLISAQDFILFKPVCESLVAKGQFKSSVMDLFGKAPDA